MNKRIIIIFLLFLFFSMSSLIINATAEEKELLNKDDLRFLGSGVCIEAVRVMKNGDIWLFKASTLGNPVQLVSINVFTKDINNIPLPLKSVDHIAISPDGKSVVLYQCQGAELWYVDIAQKKSTLIGKRKPGQSGFGLYPGQKSCLVYSGDNLFAKGYLYNEKMKFIGNALIKLDMTKIEQAAEKFEKIVSYDALIKISKKYYPKMVAIGGIEVSKRYLAFAVMDKDKEGQLIGFDVQDQKDFFIDKFAVLLGCNLTSDGKLLCYYMKNEAKKSSHASLYVYDMETQKRTELLKEILFSPVFNSSGNKLAVGCISWDNEKKRMYHEKVVLIDLKKDFAKKTIYLSKKHLFSYMEFIKDDKSLLLFDLEKSVFCELKLDEE